MWLGMPKKNVLDGNLFKKKSIEQEHQIQPVLGKRTPPSPGLEQRFCNKLKMN